MKESFFYPKEVILDRVRTYELIDLYKYIFKNNKEDEAEKYFRSNKETLELLFKSIHELSRDSFRINKKLLTDFKFGKFVKWLIRKQIIQFKILKSCKIMEMNYIGARGKSVYEYIIPDLNSLIKSNDIFYSYLFKLGHIGVRERKEISWIYKYVDYDKFFQLFFDKRIEPFYHLTFEELLELYVLNHKDFTQCEAYPYFLISAVKLVQEYADPDDEGIDRRNIGLRMAKVKADLVLKDENKNKMLLNHYSISEFIFRFYDYCSLHIFNELKYTDNQFDKRNEDNFKRRVEYYTKILQIFVSKTIKRYEPKCYEHHNFDDEGLLLNFDKYLADKIYENHLN